MVPTDRDSVTGFGAVPNWMIRDTSLDYKVKLVYLVLSSHAGASGITWPGQELIASEAGISVASVKRALAKMRQMGVLRVVPVKTAHGRRNNYHLLVSPFGGVGSR